VFVVGNGVDASALSEVDGAHVVGAPQLVQLVSAFGAATYELEPEATFTCLSPPCPPSEPIPALAPWPGFRVPVRLVSESEMLSSTSGVSQILAATGPELDTRGISPFATIELPLEALYALRARPGLAGGIDFAQVDGIYLAMRVNYRVGGAISGAIVPSCDPAASFDEAGVEDAALECGNGVDDDGDGLADCDDATCDSTPVCP
jgi:hypothetical protein